MCIRVAKRDKMSNAQPYLQFPKAPSNLAAVTEATDKTMKILDATYEKQIY